MPNDPIETDQVDYQAWAVDLLSVLDAIEQVADDEEAVRRLCRFRFTIARQHGLTIVFSGHAGTA